MRLLLQPFSISNAPGAVESDLGELRQTMKTLATLDQIIQLHSVT